MISRKQAADASTAVGRPGLATATSTTPPATRAPERSGVCPRDCAVDAFLDEQATGPDIYADYVPPWRPRWRDLIEFERGSVL